MLAARVERLGFLLFFASTPFACFMVLYTGSERFTGSEHSTGIDQRHYWAIVNSYAFSVGMCLIYMAPFLSRDVPFAKRLDHASWNWVIWLSVFTHLVFQIPHNLFPGHLHAARGTAIEWPFWSYALSDSRWSDYMHVWPNGSTGLHPDVWLINWNDGGLGLAVGLAALLWRRHRSPERKVWLLLVTVFRDATLWRETVEYMWDHHRGGYAHTTQHVVLRKHAVACLWLVNVLWLVAPVLTAVWAVDQLMALISHHAGAGAKRKAK